MSKPDKPPKVVREPVQVYLDTAERALLDRVASATKLPRAEVLRRGLRAYGSEVFAAESPVLKFLREIDHDWPSDVPSDAAARHDEYLAESYASPSTSRSDPTER
jgi:hypothetical protein